MAKVTHGKKGEGLYDLSMIVSDIKKTDRVATVRVTVTKGKLPSDMDAVAGLPVTFSYSAPGKEFVQVPQVPDTLNPDETFTTNSDGIWEHQVSIEPGTERMTFMATVQPDDLKKPLSIKRTFDLKDQWRAAKPPKFVAVSNDLGEGRWRIKMSLMDPLTEVGVAGKVELSPTKKGFRIGRKTIKPGETEPIELPEHGQSLIIEYSEEGICLIDVTIPGYPNEKQELKLYGVAEKGIALSDPPKALEILFEDYR
jgi:hypothetical protein